MRDVYYIFFVSQPSSSCIPVISSMTSTHGRPLCWINLKEDGRDLTRMQNITSSLLKGLIGGGHSLEFHIRNMVYEFRPKTGGSYRGID